MNTQLNILLKQAKFDLKCPRMRWQLGICPRPRYLDYSAPKPLNCEGQLSPSHHKFQATPLIHIEG